MPVYTLKVGAPMMRHNDQQGEPTLAWLKAQVDGYIEIVRLNAPQAGFGKGTQMIVNEEGKLRELPVNILATVLYRQTAVNNGWDPNADVICGDVVLLTDGEVCT